MPDEKQQDEIFFESGIGLIYGTSLCRIPSPILSLDYPFTSEQKQQLQEADTALNTMRFDEALSIYLRLQSELPDLPDLDVQIAQVYCILNDHNQQIQYLKTALAKDLNHFRATHNLGLCYKKMDKFDPALKYMKRALEIRPDSSITHNNLGNLYSKMQKSELAIQSHLKAIEFDPEIFGFYRNLANVYYDIKQYKDALPYFKKSFELNPNDYESMYYLGICYELTEQCQAQFELYNQNLSLAPSQEKLIELYERMAYTAYESDWVEETIDCCLRLTEFEFEGVDNYKEILSLCSKEALISAIPYSEKVIELEPDNDNVHNWKRIFYLHFMSVGIEHQTKALHYGKTGMEKFPESFYFPFHIARILLEEFDQPEEALPYIEKALEIKPDDPDSLAIKKAIHEKLGQA